MTSYEVIKSVVDNSSVRYGKVSRKINLYSNASILQMYRSASQAVVAD